MNIYLRHGKLNSKLSTEAIKDHKEEEININCYKMGSIQDLMIPDENSWKGGDTTNKQLGTDQGNREGFRSLKIAGLETDLNSSPTGVKEEVLLLSWFIVLLRTREEDRISYEWAYQSQSNNDASSHKRLIRCISSDQVVPDLQSKVEQVTTSIARHINAAASNQNELGGTSPASIILSTSLLSQTSDRVNDEVS